MKVINRIYIHDDTNDGHTGKVEPLGNHLGSDQHIDLAGLKVGQDAFMRTNLPCGIAIKPRDSGIREFGRHLGLAFQITDDLLDYLGVTQETGKEVGNDFKEGKVTLPLIIALTRAEERDRERLLALIKDVEPTAETFKEAVGLIEKYDGFNYTRKRAEEHIEQALQYLHQFPKNETRELLEGISRYVLVRRH